MTKQLFRNYDSEKYPTVFEEGDWFLIKDRIGGTHDILTAKHKCLKEVENWTWMASDNVVRGSCSYCHDPCPDSIKTLWYLYNADALPFYWNAKYMANK